MRHKIILIVSIFLTGFAIYFVTMQGRSSNALFSDFGVSLPHQNKILGIDVSHHQGKINWDKALDMKINADSIQFVYLKVTEGISFLDPQYKRNRKALDQKKVKVGVYHFFSPNISARKQANYFIQNFKKTSLLPVIDVEVTGKLNRKQLVDSVNVFMNSVEQILGVKPIVYTYESFYNDYFKGSHLEPSIFWIAAYTRTCKICDQENVISWQFSDKGTINGISEKVDLNSAKDLFWEKALW